MRLFHKAMREPFLLRDKTPIIAAGTIAACIALTSGNYADARENFDDWDPNVPVALDDANQKRLPLPGFKKFTSLFDDLSKPVRANPKDVRYLLERASWLMGYGLYEEAILDLKKAQKYARKGDEGVAIRLAQCHFCLQDYQQTLWLARQVLARNPRNASGLAVKALGLIENPDRALSECDKAIKINDKTGWFYLVRAKINQYNNQNWSQSLKDSNRALQLSPNSLPARLSRARAYLNLKNYKAAITDCNTIIGAEPMYFDAYKVRSKAYAKSGKKQLSTVDRYLYKTCLKRMKQVVKENQS